MHLDFCASSSRTCVPCVSAVPLPTFVLGPQSTEHAQFFEKVGPDGGELCENITCLGRQKNYCSVQVNMHRDAHVRVVFCLSILVPWNFSPGEKISPPTLMSKIIYLMNFMVDLLSSINFISYFWVRISVGLLVAEFLVTQGSEILNKAAPLR